MRNVVILSLGLILVSGCPVAAPTARSLPSPLSPGIYFGTEVCEAEATRNGQTATDTYDLSDPLRIGESGIPMRNGEEEYEGRADLITFSGMEFWAEVIDVSVFSNGVSVLAEGEGTSGDATVRFREEVVYSPLRGGRIAVNRDIHLFGFSRTETLNATSDCSGVYSR